MPTRSSEQCRDRWQEVLNPGSGRGKWGTDEDKALLDAYKTIGEGRWKEISLLVGNGRSDSMVSLWKIECCVNLTADSELRAVSTPICSTDEEASSGQGKHVISDAWTERDFRLPATCSFSGNTDPT